MLQSIKKLYGNKLGASDGEIGYVNDFYFDDLNWTVRYLVADTGSWLPGRQVLISPYSMGHLEQMEKIQHVKLTRKQIEDSPLIELRKPVSRQYEEDYYRYYDWPYYWLGDALWGTSGFPNLERLSKPSIHEKSKLGGPHSTALDRTDPQLRSTQAVFGYQLQADDAIIGHVCDFMIDAYSWEIGQLVIRTGHRLSGEEMVIPTQNVDRISFEESTISATLSWKNKK